MTGALTAICRPWQQSYPAPATAAALTMLDRLPAPAPRLDAALKAVAPRLPDGDRADWVAVLGRPMLHAAISTPRCVAAFLGQCALESRGFTALEEDLNYTAARLCQVWPSRFPDEAAANQCAAQPEILANHVYAGRMGNGDEASGDGWRFRGRGLIQITGRAAYQRFARAMGMSLDEATEYAATRPGAGDSAAWFWTANGLNALASSWSIGLLSRKINGGSAGAADRVRLCEAALQAIGA